MRKLFVAAGMLLIVLGLLAAPDSALAAAKGRLLFIPHDDRPISSTETADVVRALGYEVVMPPPELLSGGTEKPGRPDALWAWARENIHGADAAMISADAMIYGGLVPSRKHSLPEALLAERVAQFENLHQENPKLRLYVFGSLMRTPMDGAHAGNEEPGYYSLYGASIFQASALADKREMQGLSRPEQAQLAAHVRAVPPDVWQDWKARRDKNLSISRKLIDLTRQGVFRYFVIGKDDNAPLSQTHREGRILAAYAAGLPETKFQMLAGIDEFGVLLLARAVNDLERQVPFISVEYNKGTGADTVPSYSDARIGDSIRSAVLVAGGMMVSRPEKADFVLLVNTNPDGKTGEANVISRHAALRNDGRKRETTRDFIQRIHGYVYQGRPVGVADIAFANGADNALMKGLRDEGLLYKIRAYSGWNTPTNSTGFVIATGLLSSRMTDDACDRLLTRRYLEDWGYQANVRTQMEHSLAQFRRADVYGRLDGYENGAALRVTALMREFARRNLPPYAELENMQVMLPWHRMFEADFRY